MFSNYSCSNCGASVGKTTTRCPSCSASLKGIRCNGCRFVGSVNDFPNDRCPKCGGAVATGLRSCPNCRNRLSATRWGCPRCQHVTWSIAAKQVVWASVLLGAAGIAYLFRFREADPAIRTGVPVDDWHGWVWLFFIPGLFFGGVKALDVILRLLVLLGQGAVRFPRRR